VSVAIFLTGAVGKASFLLESTKYLVMEGTGSVKVENGKLVKVHLEYNGKIESAEIVGDFFVEPAEAIGDLEDALLGLSASVEDEKIVERIEEVDAELIGFSAEDVAQAVNAALED